MRNLFLLTFALVVLCSCAMSEPAQFYEKGSTWQETMRVSRDNIVRMEQNGEFGVPLPDMGESSFTVMTWLKTEADSGVIFTKAQSWQMMERTSGTIPYQQKSLYIDDGALAYEISGGDKLSSEKKINDGKWHHLAIVGDDSIEFYVDGKSAKKGKIGSVEADGEGTVFQVGVGMGGRSRKPGFNGDLDELRIYCQALSAEEITSVYENSGEVKGGLAGWYTFDKEAEEGTPDSSGNEYHAFMYRVEGAEGKVGKGLRFTGRGGIFLPEPKGNMARAGIWEQLAEDFTDSQSAKEMKLERGDNIWGTDWTLGDVKELAARYANAARSVGKLDEKAAELAEKVGGATDLEQVCSLYHRSIVSDKLCTDIPAKIQGLRTAVSRMAEQYKQEYTNAGDYLARADMLDGLLAKLEMNPEDQNIITQLKDGLGKLQHEALVSNNPLIDFESLLYIKRPPYHSSHYYTFFVDGCDRVFRPDNNIYILDVKTGEEKAIVPSLAGGIFGRMDLSFDASKIVFDYKPNIESGFRVWEVNVDSTGLRQLTLDPPDEQARIALFDKSDRGVESDTYNNHTDDMHPCYLADGGIAFVSTRCQYEVYCNGTGQLSVPVLHRMDGDGTNVEKLTNSGVSEFTPIATNDGRIAYHRWEYVDKSSVSIKALWAMNPDGTKTVEIFGNNHNMPSSLWQPRPIPGNDNLFVFTGVPHYPQAGYGTVLKVGVRHEW